MTGKKYEYLSKDVPILKKDVLIRFIYLALFVAVFIWQVALLLVNNFNDTLHPLMIISGIFVLFSSLALMFVTTVYSIKDIKAIKTINKHGRIVMGVASVFSGKNGKMLKMYQLIATILAYIMLVVLTVGVTYSILEFSFFSTFNAYMPFLFLVSISGFNSLYHVKSEIKTINAVKEYNSIY